MNVDAAMALVATRLMCWLMPPTAKRYRVSELVRSSVSPCRERLHDCEWPSYWQSRRRAAPENPNKSNHEPGTAWEVIPPSPA